MKILIKTASTGKIIVFPLEVKISDSIRNVKLMIMEKKEIPRSKQVLIFNGKQLEDEFTLAEYCIQDESTLHLMMCTLDFKSSEGIAEYLKMLMDLEEWTDIPLTTTDDESNLKYTGGSNDLSNEILVKHVNFEAQANKQTCL